MSALNVSRERPADDLFSLVSGVVNDSFKQLVEMRMLKSFYLWGKEEGRKQVYYVSQQASLLLLFYLKPRHSMTLWDD